MSILRIIPPDYLIYWKFHSVLWFCEVFILSSQNWSVSGDTGLSERMRDFGRIGLLFFVVISGKFVISKLHFIQKTFSELQLFKNNVLVLVQYADDRLNFGLKSNVLHSFLWLIVIFFYYVVNSSFVKKIDFQSYELHKLFTSI